MLRAAWVMYTVGRAAMAWKAVREAAEAVTGKGRGHLERQVRPTAVVVAVVVIVVVVAAIMGEVLVAGWPSNSSSRSSSSSSSNSSNECLPRRRR